jgi:anti-anti-sigma factor
MPNQRQAISARVCYEGDSAVIRFAGSRLSITHDNARDFYELLRPAAQWAGRRRLVLDLCNVDLVSAAGLGVLVKLHKELRDAGTALVLRGLQEPVHEVFEATRLTELLNMEPAAAAPDAPAPAPHPSQPPPRPLPPDDSGGHRTPTYVQPRKGDSSMKAHTGPAVLRAALAILAVALALSLTSLFPPLRQSPYALFLAAVALSAWYAGWWAALLATVLSGLALDFFFLPPLYTLGPEPEDGVRLGAFLFAGGLTVLLEATRARLEASLAQRVRRGRESLAVIAHELRNFLHPMATAARALRGEQVRGPAADRCLEILERKLQQMGRLVHDLVDAGRLEQGKLRLRLESVDLAAAVRDAVDAALPLFEERGHQVTFQGPAVALRLEADATRLEQIVTNLLINAAKYTERGGRIAVRVERAPAEAVVRVRDTGVGIAPDKLSHVFDLFAQAGRGTPDGLGVGLSLARSLARLHGGDVTVRSDGPGMGSEFVVHLPLPSVERQAAGSRERAGRT